MQNRKSGKNFPRAPTEVKVKMNEKQSISLSRTNRKGFLFYKEKGENHELHELHIIIEKFGKFLLSGFSYYWI